MGMAWPEQRGNSLLASSLHQLGGKKPVILNLALFLDVFEGGFRSGVSENGLIENTQLTFQCVEKFPSGDVKNIDDSVDRSTGQVLSIRALSGEPAVKRVID